MRIIWTCWKVAVSRDMWQWAFAVVIVCVSHLLFYVRDEPSVGEVDSHSLSDYLWHYPFFALLPFWFLFVVPLRCHREWHALTEASFSFCLPGHRESVRRLCFSCALLVGLACCLLWMGTEFEVPHSDQSGDPIWQAIVLSALGSFLAGMAAFLVVTASRFVLAPLVWGILALLSIPLFGLGVLAAYDICEHPRVAIPVFAAVVVFFWIRLGNVQSVTRGHRAIIYQAMDRQTQAGVKRTAPAWMGGLFLDWARRCPALGLERYVWASLYRTFGRALSYWKWAILGALAISLLLVPASREAAEVVFAALGCAAVFIELPVTSALLVPGGRRERYCATAMVVLATSLLLVTLGLGIAGVSELIAMGFGAAAQDLGFRFSTAWLACVFVPWIGILQLRGRAWQGIEELAMVVVIGVLALQLLSQSVNILEWFIRMRLLAYAGVCLVGWAFFLLRLRRVCARGCLPKKSHGV